jgi:hypothetical protein
MLPLPTFATKCPRDFKTDSTMESSTGSIIVRVVDPVSAAPVDIVEAVGGVGAVLPDGYTVEYRVREAHWAPMLCTIPVLAGNPAEGTFDIPLTPVETKYPGVFLAELVVLDELGVRRFSDMRYLEIAPTLDLLKHSGVPTVAEVRLYLRDTPADNTLLDDAEFSIAEVMAALRRPIDIWNEMPPDVVTYTAATFPWREHWMQAAVGYLLKTASYHYYRNELTYSSGGLSSVEKDKGKIYQGLANESIAEFKEWAMRKKVEINMNMGYGTLGSSYGRRW